MKNTTMLLIALSFVICSCSFLRGISYEGPEKKMRENIDSTRVVIVGFKTEGYNIPPRSEEYLTSRLFDLLYVKGNFILTDSDKVDEKAQYTIEGLLTQTSTSLVFDTDSKFKLIMSLRVVNNISGEVAGVITASSSFRGDVQEQIDELLEMCSDELTETE